MSQVLGLSFGFSALLWLPSFSSRSYPSLQFSVASMCSWPLPLDSKLTYIHTLSSGSTNSNMAFQISHVQSWLSPIKQRLLPSSPTKLIGTSIFPAAETKNFGVLLNISSTPHIGAVNEFWLSCLLFLSISRIHHFLPCSLQSSWFKPPSLFACVLALASYCFYLHSSQ